MRKIKKIPLLSESDIWRFWSKSAITANPKKCWNWQASVSLGPEKYGRFKIKDVMFYAHRIAYYINYGVDPIELQVNHTCDNPSCVNPNHLYLGTVADNSRDMVERGRSAKGENHGVSKLTD